MENSIKKYAEVVEACITNGKRLLEDSECLNDFDRFSTAKALAILAQEEFAKAYIIKLVQEGAIPWCDGILRATRDHHCKQLISVIMEYLFTPWEDTNKLIERDKKIREKFQDFLLPPKVADALNIFFHEKIRRWKSSSWFWAEDPKYDQDAKKVWKGKIEKIKQNSIYVSIGKDGKICNIPQDNREEAQKHIEFAKVLEDVAAGHDVFAFTEREYIKSALKEMFSYNND
jgi:AbiV family abortive infection protein